MKVCREHFIPDLPSPAARALFKSSVEIVPISISRHCNRICDYCPNSFVDRLSVHDLMDDGLFASVIGQLGEIYYDGTVCINRYNEPLADMEYALRRVRQIRAAMPAAKIEISSNGDFLDRDGVWALYQAGVTDLIVTCHQQPKVHDFSNLIRLLEIRLGKLGLPMFDLMRWPNVAQASIAVGPNMKFMYRAFDADYLTPDGELTTINDRGGIYPTPYRRSAPCFRPFRAFEVEWDGSLWPCCQIHNDVPQHMEYCLGHLTPESDIFAVWVSETYVAWRKEMFSYDAKRAPCASCNFMVGDVLGDSAKDRGGLADMRERWGL